MRESTLMPEAKLGLGVIGGMGPLASAEFVRTIYEYSLGRPEQDAPFVALYSDPSIPDRTTSLLDGDLKPLLFGLRRALDGVRSLGADKIVICCITGHELLKHLSEDERRGIISLVDIVMRRVSTAPNRRYLLLSTNGARKLRIFEGHPAWPLVREKLICPVGGDQQTVHDLIYDLKRSALASRHIDAIKKMLVKYETDSLIAGCTEIHLIVKDLMKAPGSGRGIVECVDPLLTIAEAMSGGRIDELLTDLNVTRVS
jgi:aspartate racemase